MSQAEKALKRLERTAKVRLKGEVHAQHDAHAVLDVDYLYRLALERQAAIGPALTADGNAAAPVDEAYVERVYAAAADVVIALALLADRVTPRRGGILPAVEARKR